MEAAQGDRNCEISADTGADVNAKDLANFVFRTHISVRFEQDLYGFGRAIEGWRLHPVGIARFRCGYSVPPPSGLVWPLPAANNQECAIRFMDYVIEFPFRSHTLRIDRGHEFQARFHWHFEDRGIRHVYVKPRTPELNGKVERSHRTDKEQF